MLTDVLRILAAALHLGVVVRLRERLLLSRKLAHGAIGGVIELLKSASRKTDADQGDLPWADSEELQA